MEVTRRNSPKAQVAGGFPNRIRGIRGATMKGSIITCPLCLGPKVNRAVVPGDSNTLHGCALIDGSYDDKLRSYDLLVTMVRCQCLKTAGSKEKHEPGFG